MLYDGLSGFYFIPSQKVVFFLKYFSKSLIFFRLILSVVIVGQKYLLLRGYFRSTPEAKPF